MLQAPIQLKAQMPHLPRHRAGPPLTPRPGGGTAGPQAVPAAPQPALTSATGSPPPGSCKARPGHRQQAATPRRDASCHCLTVGFHPRRRRMAGLPPLRSASRRDSAAAASRRGRAPTGLTAGLPPHTHTPGGLPHCPSHDEPHAPPPPHDRTARAARQPRIDRSAVLLRVLPRLGLIVELSTRERRSR